MTDQPFSWRGKRVFLTGHTGFKGGWLALWLASKGAIVRGYALDPCTDPNLFTAARVGSVMEDIRGDIRNPATLEPALHDFAPEVVFHLAAQPLVRASYADPIGTYETNVIGTARVLDAIRRTPSVRAVVSVTTDKGYENHEDPPPLHRNRSPRRLRPLLLLQGLRRDRLRRLSPVLFPVANTSPSHSVALATARAGNVIGGGDWSADRLLPDLVRGFLAGQPVPIRRPIAIRPWQHVVEPLHGYILLAEHLLSADPARYATAYNFGPTDNDAQPVAWIVDKMTAFWGDGASWVLDPSPASTKPATSSSTPAAPAPTSAGHPHLHLETALEWLVEWYRAWQPAPTCTPSPSPRSSPTKPSLTRSSKPTADS